ncbi:MAG: hypothetical protein LQ345_002379 [Seirophora villosa]|nr:MAG: hypothetical protein LQ345_002379 [Seirophora villosa]
MTSEARTLAALLQRASIDDHEEILRACNASLKQSKKDLRSLHAKVVALLKLDRYEDALHVLEDGGESLKDEARLERSYALYKTGQLAEAERIAQRIDDDRGARHVEAQALYRLEDFERSALLYRELSQTHAIIDNEENDIRINGGAADAQLEWTSKGYLVHKKKPGREDLEAFELAYNAACASIARGELAQGEVLLRRSQGSDTSALDDLTHAEKVAELLPIQVQQLYVLIRLGKSEDAVKLASQITPKDITDGSTQQVAEINRIAASEQVKNPYLYHRIVNAAAPLPKTDKLFTVQLNQIDQDRLVLDLLISKFGGVIKSTNKTLSENPPPTTSSHLNSLSVLNAAAHAQGQLGKIGIKHMLPLLEKRPLDVGLAMVVIQLYMLTNNNGSAATVLESLLKHLENSTSAHDQDVRFAPGLVATVVSLYTLQGRRKQIKTELAKAATYWRHKSKPPRSLLEAAGLTLVESSKPDDQASAQDIFNVLRQEDPSSKIAAAGYVAAHAFSSTSVAGEANTLTPVSRLVADIDTSALEEAGVLQSKLGLDAAAQAAATRKRALDEKPKPAKKRLRKSRLPKDYDASKAPDPERWLPLKERSSYRPKGKKGRQKVAALTQGGVEKGGDAGAAASSGGKGGGGEGVIKAAAGGGGGGKAKSKKKSKK